MMDILKGNIDSVSNLGETVKRVNKRMATNKADLQIIVNSKNELMEEISRNHVEL
jgi:hypothetical protein